MRPGRVQAVDRDGLIVLAEALVFPSEYEGFGAPVLEAMALGTPVVCSDRGALPEVVGDAGIVLPPTVEAWADALAKVVANRGELVERGRLRAARFTTAESGSALAAAYRAAGGSGARPCDWSCICPHFEPDTAPTGRVMTRIVEELVARGHHVDVVTSLPWYQHHRVESRMEGGGRPSTGHALGNGQPSQSVSRR